MNKTQKMKAGTDTGSFFNFLMGNNATVPVVGKGATILHWSDRKAYEVTWVSKDGKSVKIRKYVAERTDNLGMSDSQDYEYKDLIGSEIEIVWRRGAWRRKYQSLEFEPAFLSEYDRQPQTHERWSEFFLPLRNEDGTYKLVEGKTYLKVNFEKVNIIFGVLQEYFDYSF